MPFVIATEQARDAFLHIASRFEAGHRDVVYFGAAGRAQGVIVPVVVWELLVEQAEEALDADLILDRLADVDSQRVVRPEVQAILERLRRG